jgi:phage terminase large subunit-like protein
MVVIVKRENVPHVFTWLYQNEFQCDQPENAHYKQWADQGHIVMTPGNTTDHAYLVEDFQTILETLEIEAVVYDRSWSTYFRKMLLEDLEISEKLLVEMSQGGALMNSPLREFDALMRAGKLVHDGNPAMTWMIGNVIKSSNKKKQIYPSKSKDENKIDGPVAAYMALDRVMTVKERPAKSGLFDWSKFAQRQTTSTEARA